MNIHNPNPPDITCIDRVKYRLTTTQLRTVSRFCVSIFLFSVIKMIYLIGYHNHDKWAYNHSQCCRFCAGKVVNHTPDTLSLPIQRPSWVSAEKRKVAHTNTTRKKYNLKWNSIFTMTSKSNAAFPNDFLRKYHVKHIVLITLLLGILK
jgi:hypothetical protein